jgi:GNAT superfamily N-acetyltransferase
VERSELLALFDRQVRLDSFSPLTDRDYLPQDEPLVVRDSPLDEGARWGWISYSNLDESNADRLIQEQIDFFTGKRQNFEWKRFGHDGPPDLDERLLRHGFVREEYETVMAVDLDEAPPEFRNPAGVVSHDIRKVTTLEGLREVARLEEAIWEHSFDWIETELAAELLLPDEPTVVYLAYLDGVPAAAAWMRFYEGAQFAALFGGSTLPQHRNLGLYTALLQTRAAEARRRAYRFLTVDAGEMSRPILEKHGFIALTTATAYKYYVDRVGAGDAHDRE